jgi:hypothetical protein
MAETQKTVVRETAPASDNIIVNQIIIRPVDRTQKDIADYRSAHRQAEQIYHAHRVRLYDLYDDVRLDGHLTGIIGKRISVVKNKTLHFIDAKGKKVDEMDTLIESKMFRDLYDQHIESKMWGISGVEFIPGKEFKWKAIPRKHIKPNLKLIALEQFGEEGFPYEDNPFIWIIGDDNDLGLLLKCAPYAIWKRGDLADWSQYIEIFGQPVRIVKYDAHDQKTKIELQQVLDESGSSLALMIPKQAEFDMKDGKQSNGDGKLQDTFKEAMNDEMSVIILGVTETTKSSKSSGYAQSQTHASQQLEVTMDDMKDLASAFNDPRFLNVLASYGYPVAGGKFVFKKELNLAMLKDRKDIDLAISNKVPFGDDYWYETYGIEKPDNYEELKAKMEEQQALTQAAKLLSKHSNGTPPAPAAPAKKDKKKKDKKEAQAIPDQVDTLSLMDKIRLTIADFFALAHKNSN